MVEWCGSMEITLELFRHNINPVIPGFFMLKSGNSKLDLIRSQQRAHFVLHSN